MGQFKNSVVQGTLEVTSAPSSDQHVVRQLEFAALQSAVSAQLHSAVTKEDSNSIVFTLAGQKISGTVRRKTSDWNTGEGLLGTSAYGMFVQLGTTGTTAAAGNHGHSAASGSAAGFMSVTQFNKLENIASQATKNSADSYLLDRTNHTGQQSATSIYDLATVGADSFIKRSGDTVAGYIQMSNRLKLWDVTELTLDSVTHYAGDVIYRNSYGRIAVSDGSIWKQLAFTTDIPESAATQHTGAITSDGNGFTTLSAGAVGLTHHSAFPSQTFLGNGTLGSGSPSHLTASEALDILGVEDGATANSPDATLLARANHTGSQLASTISDFDSAVSALAVLTDGGGTVAGNISFSGTNPDHYGIKLKSMTQTQRTALNSSVPSAAAIYNSTYGRPEIKVATSTWRRIAYQDELPDFSAAPANTLFGNNAESTAVATNLTPSQVRAMLSVVTNTNVPSMTVRGNKTGSPADTGNITMEELSAMLSITNADRANESVRCYSAMDTLVEDSEFFFMLAGRDWNIEDLVARVDDAPVAGCEIAIKVDGVDFLSTNLWIDPGQMTSVGSETPFVIDEATFPEGTISQGSLVEVRVVKNGRNNKSTATMVLSAGGFDSVGDVQGHGMIFDFRDVSPATLLLATETTNFTSVSTLETYINGELDEDWTMTLDWDYPTSTLTFNFEPVNPEIGEVAIHSISETVYNSVTTELSHLTTGAAKGLSVAASLLNS